MCVCSCARSASTPPLLAGVCGVGVCARGSGFGCAPTLLARVLGCVRVPGSAPLVPHHSRLGCVVWVCVLGPGFRLRLASPGWGVGVCVCLCTCSACTPPLLAGVCGVHVCVWALVLAAPRHSLLGRVGVCVLVCPLRLYPATPGWGVRRGCVCLGSGFGCGPPLLAGVLGCGCVRVPVPLVTRHSWLGCVVCVCVLGLWFPLRPATPGLGVVVCVSSCARSACTPPLLTGVCGVCVCAWARVSAARRHSWLGCWGVCVFVCSLRLYPATRGWAVRCWCVCLGWGFSCGPPLLAGVFGCVRDCVRATLVPRHSWLGCAAWVCVLEFGFRLRPASSGSGVGVCVCSCARSASTPQLLARVFGVCVCVWARVSVAPRHSSLAFWGVCVFVCPLRLYSVTPGSGMWCGCVFGLGF